MLKNVYLTSCTLKNCTVTRYRQNDSSISHIYIIEMWDA